MTYNITKSIVMTNYSSVANSTDGADSIAEADSIAGAGSMVESAPVPALHVSFKPRFRFQ